jgi:hypothetical protein
MPKYLPVCHERFRPFFNLVIAGILKRGSPASGALVALNALAQRIVRRFSRPVRDPGPNRAGRMSC